MTDNARKLLQELYEMRDEDDVVNPEFFYRDETKSKTFEKYIAQLEELEFINVVYADDEVDFIALTVNGIEAAEDEPGSRFTELMNPTQDDISYEELEKKIKSAIAKAGKDDRKRLNELLTQMTSLSQGNKVNIGDIVKNTVLLSSNFVSVVNGIVAFLKNFSG